MQSSITSGPADGGHRTDDTFDMFADRVRQHFAAVVAQHGPHLFRVDAGDLNAIYLDNLPDQARQHHTCSACRSFLTRYGNVVAITPGGDIIPAMWPNEPGPGIYDDSSVALYRAVAAGRVTGVFLSEHDTWGQPVTGLWTHFSVQPFSIHQRVLLTAGQAMAEKREHHGTLSRALAEFKPEIVTQAVTLLEADAVYRAEKVIGPAKFLRDLHTALSGAGAGSRRRNVIWRAVAGAPAGFCTPRSSMIGTLLEDLEAGTPFDSAKRKFAAKMHPLQYQRPQRQADAGNIAQAEKAVAALGIESSLRRRYARLEEVRTIWLPQPVGAQRAGGGVFDHLKAEPAPPVGNAMTPIKITWEKFARTVMPDARAMEVLLSGAMNLGALVTAVDPDAPPILQWDREDARNPVSWYLYNGGTRPERWALRSGTWGHVTGIALRPTMWVEGMDHHGKGAMFILEGARDTDIRELALFPECLRAELHSVRRTIEQFSKTRKIEEAEQASACGLIVTNQNEPHSIRVHGAGGTVCYHIDRWD